MRRVLPTMKSTVKPINLDLLDNKGYLAVLQLKLEEDLKRLVAPGYTLDKKHKETTIPRGRVIW